MRIHEIRDLFRTEFHRAQTYSGADADCAEFFLEHIIDPLKYDKIMRDKKYAMEQYRKALPWLNILSEDPRKIDRTDYEAQREADRAERKSMSDEMVKMKREMAELRGLVEKRKWNKE